MIGIVPSSSKTFEVEGTIGKGKPEEGKLYVDPSDKRLYFYSTIITRSNPENGYFPIWNGRDKIVTQFSNEKYLSDVIKLGLKDISSKLSTSKAKDIIYRHRRSGLDGVLSPQIKENDNMFTQVVKGIIAKKQVSLVDLEDMSGLPENVIRNYYSALTKIAFMRIDRWLIWIDQVFKLRYSITVYKGKRKLLSYEYPGNKFDCGGVCYDTITKSTDDHLKKIVKILMIIENLSKHDLRSEEIDDYTINNMLTTLNTGKPLSAQLFSRFIRMAKLNYVVEVHEKGDTIFEYRE